jgi:hypothetical protein
MGDFVHRAERRQREQQTRRRAQRVRAAVRKVVAAARAWAQTGSKTRAEALKRAVASLDKLQVRRAVRAHA